MKDESERHHNSTRVRLNDEDDLLAEHVARIKDLPKAVFLRMLIRQELVKYRFAKNERSLSSHNANGSAREALIYAEPRLAE